MSLLVTFTVVGVDGVVSAVGASVVAGEELTLAAEVLFVDVVAPEVVVVSTLVDMSVLAVLVLEATASSELGAELVEPSADCEFGVLVERPDNGIGAANKQATSAKIGRIVVRGGGGRGTRPNSPCTSCPAPPYPTACLPGEFSLLYLLIYVHQISILRPHKN